MLHRFARAKLNWTLDILRKRSDGYHDMDMLMQEISLCDELWFEESDTLSLHSYEEENQMPTESPGILGSPPVLYDGSNIILRAAKALLTYTGRDEGVSITLKKQIPSGAGLGGGSADAAAVLQTLNELWKLYLSQDELYSIGAKLGADIPFMLHGGFARVSGIGEIIHPLPSLPTKELLLIQPCPGLSTSEIFKAYDQMAPELCRPETNAAEEALKKNDLVRFKAYAGNVLETVSIKYRPEILTAKQELSRNGADYAAMSGSGSAVFGVFPSKETRDSAYDKLKQSYSGIWKAHTV